MYLTVLASHPAASAALLGAIARRQHGASIRDAHVWAALLTHPALDPDVRAEMLTRVAEAPARAPGPVVRALVRAPCHPHEVAMTLLDDDAVRGEWIAHLRDVDEAAVVDMLTLVSRRPSARHTLVPALLEAGALDVPSAHHLARTLAGDPRPLPAARTWLASILERRCGPGGAELAAQLAQSTSDPQVADDLVRVGAHTHRASPARTPDPPGATMQGPGDVRRGVQMPAAALLNCDELDEQGRRDLHEALRVLLPQASSRESAHTFLGLLKEFHGTLEELFCATRGVAT